MTALRPHRAAARALLAALALAASPAPAQPPPAAPDSPGIVLSSGEISAEIQPGPRGVSVFLRDSEGRPLPAGAVRPRIVLRVPGMPVLEADLLPDPADPRPGALHARADLRRADSFTAVLLFEIGGAGRVLRFPPLQPFPPYLVAAPSHDASPHSHVTPHDGAVEVVGDAHAELALEGWRLRLFWYDVAMNPVAASGVSARAWLEPCEGATLRVDLAPPEGSAPDPPFLEGEIPRACGPATRLVLQADRGERSWTFRYPLAAPLAETIARTPLPIAVARAGHLRLELRPFPGGEGFPGPSVWELRLLGEPSLAPVDLRRPPFVFLRVSPGGRVPLSPPLRLEAPGRWRVEAWAPPQGAALEVALTTLDGEVVSAVLPLPPRSPWRRVRPLVLAAALAAGAALVLLCSRRSALPGAQGEPATGSVPDSPGSAGPPAGAGPDLLPVLGLRPLQTARLLPAAFRWIFLPVVVLGAARALATLPGGNPGAWLLAGLLGPAAFLAAFLLGRIGCSLCPLPAATDFLRDLSGARRPFPARLLRPGPPLPSSTLLPGRPVAWFAVLALPLLAFSRSPAPAGAALLAALAGALAMSLRWDGRPFCAVICPLGAALGAASAAAPLRLDAETEACEGSPACPGARDPSRWSVLTAACCDCGRRAMGTGASPRAVRAVVPFREWLLTGEPPFPGVAPRGAGFSASALLGAAFVLLLVSHPVRLLVAASPAAAGIGIAAWIALLLCAAFGPVPASLHPLALCGIAAAALPPLVAGLRILPAIPGALLAGEPLPVPAASPLSAGAMSSLQLAILLTGAALSSLSGWRLAGASGDGRGRLRLPLRRLVATALPLALAALLGVVLLGCFHSAGPAV